VAESAAAAPWFAAAAIMGSAIPSFSNVRREQPVVPMECIPFLLSKGQCRKKGCKRAVDVG
jgi:hypothetical protein